MDSREVVSSSKDSRKTPDSLSQSLKNSSYQICQILNSAYENAAK